MRILVVIVALALLVGGGAAALPNETRTAARAEPPVMEAPTTATGGAATITYEVAPGSQVRFIIDEVFRGEPLTVVGVNTKVAGQIAGDPAEPQEAAIGPITINAAAFKTEKGEAPAPLGNEVGWRDAAVNHYILDVDAHPLITFEPEMPTGPIVEGVETEIAGNLTVRDITRPVTFTVTFRTIRVDRVEVSGSAAVTRSSFGLEIPDVAHATGAEDELLLEVDLVYVPAD
jgi:polyisoprenoid-binding protein YceI